MLAGALGLPFSHRLLCSVRRMITVLSVDYHLFIHSFIQQTFTEHPMRRTPGCGFQEFCCHQADALVEDMGRKQGNK